MKKPILLTLFSIFVIPGFLLSQAVNVSDAEMFSKLEGVTSTEVKLFKKIDKLLFAEHSYDKALPFVLDLHRIHNRFDPLRYRLALCYLNSEDKSKALPLLLKCKAGVNPLYYYNLAKAFHYEGDFEQARTYYVKFYSEFHPDDYHMFYEAVNYKRKEFSFVDMMIDLQEACEIGRLSIDHSHLVEFTHFFGLNSAFDDVYPILLPDDVLLFSSNRKFGAQEKFKIYKIGFDSNVVFGAPIISDLFPINTNQEHLAMPSSVSSNYLLYDNLGDDGDISFVESASTDKVKGMKFPSINSNKNEVSACLLNDTTIVFSSDKSGNQELYISFRITNKKWSKPIAIPNKINTTGREEVTGYFDGYLYYSSNGKGTIGGFDVFKVPYLGANEWGDPENMGYPFNTAYDDFGFSPISENLGLYWGIRPEGKGGSDIYKVEITSLVPDQEYENDQDLDDMLWEYSSSDTDSLTIDSVVGVVLEVDSFFSSENYADSVSYDVLINANDTLSD